MKKYILSFMMLVVSASFLTSCLGDNGNSNSNQPTKVTVTSGLYVVNCGIWGGNNGSLTLYDYNTLKAQQLFSGIGELGDTPNDAYTKGDTIFIVVNTDNMIVVFNRKTMKVDRISTTKEMGETEGLGPRCITGFGDNIYFTTYGNYVARMDAKTLTVTDMKQVGNAPEGLSLGGTYSAPLLYVCNSNYGTGGGSISKIPLASDGSLGKVETITHEKIRNPQEVVAEGDGFYFLDWGYYNEDYTKQFEAGLFYYNNGNVTQIIENATGLGVGYVYDSYGNAVGYNLVTFNAPYGSDEKPTYTQYNTATGSKKSITLKDDTGHEIFSPVAIGVDPLKGLLVIASRTKSPDTEKADIKLPGYANVYQFESEGVYKYVEGSNFVTGIDPHVIEFTLDTQTIVYQ